MHRNFLATGAILGAIAIALGAFGAHGLKQMVATEAIQTFQTGVQYQVYHALALMCTGILYSKLSHPLLKWSGICFITGIILFSGSLYLITVFKATGITAMNGIGMITPAGGLFFIAGWLLLCAGIMKKN